MYPALTLKLKLGQHITPSSTLLPPDQEGQLLPESMAIQRTRSKQLGSRDITEVLVQWHGTSLEKANWKSLM